MRKNWKVLVSAMLLSFVLCTGCGNREQMEQPDHTATPTLEVTVAPTETPMPEPTATNTPTPAPTATSTPTPVPTATNTPTPVPTATNTPTPEPTATSTPTPVPTATNTPTPEPTATNTPTPEPTATNTPTPEPTATSTPTPVPTATNTPTPKPTATNTPTPKPTATNTPTPVPTATNTPTPMLEKKLLSMYCTPEYNNWSAFEEGDDWLGGAEISKEQLEVYGPNYMYEALRENYEINLESQRIQVPWTYKGCDSVGIESYVGYDEEFNDIYEIKEVNALIFETEKHLFYVYQDAWWGQDILFIYVIDNATNEKVENIWLHYVWKDGECLFLSDMEARWSLIKNAPNEAVVDGIRYKLNTDGSSYSVEGLEESGSMETVIIPDTCYGLPVTKIESMAFWYDEVLREIKLPDTIVEIGERAFCECLMLNKINIPKGITTIRSLTFAGTSISMLTLPEGLTTIEESAFSLSTLIELTIPLSLTNISESAFEETYLTTVNFVGTVAQWITLSEGKNIISYEYGVVNCSDGTYNGKNAPVEKLFAMYFTPGYNQWSSFSEGDDWYGYAILNESQMEMNEDIDWSGELINAYEKNAETEKIVIPWTYVECIEVDVVTEILWDNGRAQNVVGKDYALVFETEQHQFKIYQSCWWSATEKLLMIDVFDKSTSEKIVEIWLCDVWVDGKSFTVSDMEERWDLINNASGE